MEKPHYNFCFSVVPIFLNTRQQIFPHISNFKQPLHRDTLAGFRKSKAVIAPKSMNMK